MTHLDDLDLQMIEETLIKQYTDNKSSTQLFVVMLTWIFLLGCGVELIVGQTMLSIFHGTFNMLFAFEGLYALSKSDECRMGLFLVYLFANTVFCAVVGLALFFNLFNCEEGITAAQYTFSSGAARATAKQNCEASINLYQWIMILGAGYGVIYLFFFYALFNVVKSKNRLGRA